MLPRLAFPAFHAGLLKFNPFRIARASLYSGLIPGALSRKANLSKGEIKSLGQYQNMTAMRLSLVPKTTYGRLEGIIFLQKL
jgi:hypothetical protein